METWDNVSALRPRSEVFAEAVRRGLEPGDDRFDRFRNQELMDDLLPIEGTTQRGFTSAQAQRFFDLLALSRQLRSKRPRASALAFWLCWNGATDVPPHLVCEHVERCVGSYLKALKRQYERRRVPIRMADDPERWRKAGMSWAKPLVDGVLRSFAGNGLMLDFLAILVGLLLRAVFSRASFEAVSGLLSRLAFLLGAKSFNIEAARTIWNIIAEGFALFTPNEETNPLLAAVRKVSAEEPEAIIGLVHDTRLVIELMGQVFPMYDLRGAPAIPESADDISTSRYHKFAPAMVSVLTLTSTHPHCVEMRKNLRAGNVELVLQEFHQVRVVRDAALDRIRGNN